MKGVYSVRAIGIDPGLAMTGFGVVETLSRGGKACEWGTIRTEAGRPIPIRLKTIYDELNELLDQWKPDLLALEEVFVLKQFPKAAIQLGEVRGVIYLAAQEQAYSGGGGQTHGGEERINRKREGG